MSLDVVETLCELVRLPSVNPMGRDASGGEFLEYRVTEYLERVFDRLGLASQRQTVAPNRDNILARLDGDVLPEEGGPILMLEVHQDTVPVDGMTIPPWTPEVRNGRVYGRGACDVKGGMAAILAAVSRLVEQRPSRLATIVIACSVNEEYGFTGASAMPQLWNGGDRAIVPRAPDAVIVAEPTELDVVVTHKGVVRWRCHARGRAAHASQPDRGVNAIYRMARVLAAMEQYARDVVPRLGQHPLLGTPTLNVGVISGGVSVNTVPDHCTIEIDRRLLPHEDPREAFEHAKSYLANAGGAEAAGEHDEPHQQICGLQDDRNGALAASLTAAVERHGRTSRCIGVPYGTDAPVFSSLGIPTVVFGPGSIQQAHTADEWIAVDQLLAAVDVFYELARCWGQSSGSKADGQVRV